MKLWLLIAFLCSDGECVRKPEQTPIVFTAPEACVLFAGIVVRYAGPSVAYQCQKAESI